jgi:hypothetical protein
MLLQHFVEGSLGGIPFWRIILLLSPAVSHDDNALASPRPTPACPSRTPSVRPRLAQRMRMFLRFCPADADVVCLPPRASLCPNDRLRSITALQLMSSSCRELLFSPCPQFEERLSNESLHKFIDSFLRSSSLSLPSWQLFFLVTIYVWNYSFRVLYCSLHLSLG